MIAKKYFYLFLLLLLATVASGRTTHFPFQGIVVELLDSAHAATVNSQSDSYTRELSPFDLQIRLHRVEGLQESNYLHLAALSVRNWPGTEEDSLKKAFAAIGAYCNKNNIRLKLPDTLQLIKTTGAEEFGAEGYTRTNRIMLNTAAQRISTHLVAHELFHVFSRYNAIRRDALYLVFGFKPCNNISYKAALSGLAITNPDCPFIMHYVTVQKDAHSIDAALVLYSKYGFKPESAFGDYINIGLLVLTGGDAQKQPALANGKGIVYDLEEVNDLKWQTGSNTPYLLHPEEIAAEHFAMLICSEPVPERAFLDKMKISLQQP